jgi:carbon-monoxide dehydrogenase large subunit
VKQLAAAAYDPSQVPPGEELGLEASVRFSAPQVFASGCYGAAVDVDRATGKVTVARIAAVDDAGTIVNPLLAEGQVIGGIVQALGECLTEEAVYDADGQPRSASLLDYSVPTAAEVPEIVTAFVETPSPYNPLGAKGIGEGGTIGALAAVSNAVANAVGRWVDPPFTEEKIWRALNEQETT